MEKPTIFICYHQKDASWKDDLVGFMDVLQQEYWTIDKIEPGETVSEKIEEALGLATVAIFFISNDSLNPEFSRRVEVSKLILRHREGLRVIPIIVRDCPYEQVEWLRGLKPLPEDGKPLSKKKENKDTELKKIAEAVAKIFGKLASKTVDSQNPTGRLDKATQKAPSKATEWGPESGQDLDSFKRQLEDFAKKSPEAANVIFDVGSKYAPEVKRRTGKRTLTKQSVGGQQSSDAFKRSSLS